MPQQSTETAVRATGKETITQLRHRMIRETEAFLNERLYRRNGDWATEVCLGGMLQPREVQLGRRHAQRTIDVRRRTEWGALIDVRPNQSGIVDNPRLQALEWQLRDLTDDPASGDIMIDVAQVAVMTAGFMSLLAVIRPRLACQNRKLALLGLRPECAIVLKGTGLEGLIEHANQPTEFVKAKVFRFEDAQAARPRGSGRAA
jgi:hypothetical protein